MASSDRRTAAGKQLIAMIGCRVEGLGRALSCHNRACMCVCVFVVVVVVVFVFVVVVVVVFVFVFVCLCVCA